MCRGNRQEPIFKDPADYSLFLKTLGETCLRCGWRIHAYVLMRNHYHLLLETPEANLVDGMRWFQGVYTQRFNARHKVWGHLFQGRYKALLVDGDGEYFATVANYIHLNPARAHCFDLKTGTLSDFSPSSYPSYMRPAQRPDWLITERVLNSLGFEDTAVGRTQYKNYMKKRVLEIAHSDCPAEVDKAWQNIRRGWVFGSDEFCEKMRDVVDRTASESRRDSHSGGAALQHDETAAQRLLEKGLQMMQLKPDNLKTMKKGAAEKKVIAWLIRKYTGVKVEWVANALVMGNVATVSRGTSEVEAATEGNLFELKVKISEFKD
jgi:REP element-mobilizing transposase RayT